MNSRTDRTCLNCGWVHFGVSRAYAEDQVKTFNIFFDGADQKTKDAYGNSKSSIMDYERCSRCGSHYTKFRDSKEGDCPAGCTIGPIIHET